MVSRAPALRISNRGPDVRITYVSCIIVRLVNLVVISPGVNWKDAGTEGREYRAGKG